MNNIRGISRSQFLRISSRLALVVMLGIKVSTSGLRYLYSCETVGGQQCVESIEREAQPSWDLDLLTRLV
jgi:hypothetical protein